MKISKSFSILVLFAIGFFIVMSVYEIFLKPSDISELPIVSQVDTYFGEDVIEFISN